MISSHYKKLLLGIVTCASTLIPLGAVCAKEGGVPVRQLTYPYIAEQMPVQEVRWGRGYYRGPYGYYGGPRTYAPRYYPGYRGYGYRGYYGAPYGAYYPGDYYRPRYGYGPGYGGYYYGGGVRGGRAGIFWR